MIVIVTDGGDTVSSKDFHAALEARKWPIASSIRFSWLPIENDAGRNIGGENALTGLAKGTGGRVFVPILGAAMDRAFDSDHPRPAHPVFAGLLSEKSCPLTKDRFHRLDVQVDRPQLQVLARSGYYGECEAGRRRPG